MLKLLRVYCTSSWSPTESSRYSMLRKKEAYPEGHWRRSVLGDGKGAAPNLLSPLYRKGGHGGCVWLTGKEYSSDLSHANFLLPLYLNSFAFYCMSFPSLPLPPVFPSELVRNSLSSDKPLQVLSLEQVFLLLLSK